METFQDFGEMLNKPVKNLSPSKVEAYLKCPEQFRLRYIEKVPEKASLFLTSGSVVHATIEYALMAKKFGEKIPEKGELDDVFLSRWKKLTQEQEHKRDFIGWAVDPEDPHEQIKEQCRALVPLFMGELFPQLTPAAMEYDVKRDYPTKYGPVMSWGKLDLMTSDGVVWDWKTTRKVSSGARKSFQQFAQYSEHAIEAIPGKQVIHATAGIMVQVKKAFLVRGAIPKIEVAEGFVGDLDRKHWAAAVAHVWEGITEGKFEPNPKHFLCKAPWCPFYIPCQGYSGE